jgi:hypothetical protein
LLLCSALLLATSGCRDLQRFDLDEGEAYCGRIVSTPVFHEGFIPTDSPPVLRLKFYLDIDNLATRPGRLYSDDAERGLCADDGGALFDAAELRTVEPVLHDPISDLSFGEGREHSVFSYVDSTCQGSMVALISMMRSGALEVRLFKPMPEAPTDAAPGERSGYALFHLKRSDEKSCGF